MIITIIIVIMTHKEGEKDRCRIKIDKSRAFKDDTHLHLKKKSGIGKEKVEEQILLL